METEAAMETEDMKRGILQQQQQEGKGEEDGKQPEDSAPDPDLPIDRGWAWVIMAASFFAILLGIGYLKAFGIIFMESLMVFKTSTFLASVIVGVQQVVFSIGGLVTQTVLLTYMSVRQCVMAGGLLVSLGMFLTFFVNSIAFFIFTQSLLVGLGLSLMANPCFVLIGQYFIRYRAIAIASAGIAMNVGGIVIPLVLTYLLQEYSFHGTLLIYGGFTLNIVVCGALLRPFDFYSKPSLRRRQRKFVDHKMTESMQPLVNGNSGVEGTDEGGLALDEISPVLKCGEGGSSTSGKVSNGRNANKLPNSSGNCPDPKEKDIGSAELAELSSTKLILECPESTEGGGMAGKNLLQPSPNSQEHGLESGGSQTGSHPHSSSSPTAGSQPESYRNLDDKPSAEKGNAASQDSESTSAPKGPLRKCITSCWPTMLAAFEFSLFKRPAFLIILSMSFFGVLPAALIGVFIPVLAVQRGLTADQGSLFLTISNCCAIVSKIVLGFVVDSKLLPLHAIFVTVQTLSSIAPFLTRFYTDFPSFLGLSLAYGFLGDVFFTMQPLLIVEMLGLEKLAKTLGFIILVNGISLAVISPLTGWLKDSTGGYEATFILLGVAALLCAAIVEAYVRIRSCQQHRRRGRMAEGVAEEEEPAL